MKYIWLLFAFLFAFTILVTLTIIVVGRDVDNINNLYNIENMENILPVNSDNLENLKTTTTINTVNINTAADIDNTDNTYIEDMSNTNILQTKQIYIKIFDEKSGIVSEMDLEKYLCGVVFAEMPSSFEFEALKAQAVAARSFCVYKMLYSTDTIRGIHKGADICNDFRHCKDYISYEEACEKYGGDYIAPLWEKIQKSVNETAGEIIVYKSEPAIAVFHAMSGKETESAANVWGDSIPYLLSVPSEEENYQSEIKNFITESRFASDEFKDILLSGGFGFSEEDFSVHPHLWVSDVRLNSSSRVDTVGICGKYLPGIHLRELFSLRSTDFSLEYDNANKEFIFTVTGYGHGVGMSQYGANLMAKEGNDYIDILLWYYTGVEIIPMYKFF